MQELRPTTAQELAQALRDAADRRQPIQLDGAGSKARMSAPVRGARTRISTTALDRLLAYEPRDLIVSVEAGMPWRRLTELIGEHCQMLPLDPPCADSATVGGVVAANCAGPRRRLYGGARDQVIGMKIATLDGDIVESGGMVVKNVAGYDLQKVMIGSFGTLGAMVSVNFKLSPSPEAEATFALAYDSLTEALEARNGLLRGALLPSALDLLNPAAATELGLAESTVLLVRAGGSPRVLDRFARELPGASRLEGGEQRDFWRGIEEFAPTAVSAQPAAVVVRAGFPAQALGAVMACARGPAIARAASGAAWLRFDSAAEALAAIAALQAAGADALIEWAGDQAPAELERWPSPGDSLDVMREVKTLFDPRGLLNPGRLHGRI
mgnify:CR=1 FL=1